MENTENKFGFQSIIGILFYCFEISELNWTKADHVLSRKAAVWALQ